MSLTREQIETLLLLVDAGIAAEVKRICNTDVTPKEFTTLIDNDYDRTFAAQIGMGLTEDNGNGN